MPSGKKNRAKQRRQAKANRVAATQQQQPTPIPLQQNRSLVCYHGLRDAPPGHIVRNAWKHLMFHASHNVGVPINDLAGKFPSIFFGEEDTFSLLKERLIFTGTITLIEDPDNWRTAKLSAQFVLELEDTYDYLRQYAGDPNPPLNAKNHRRKRDLTGGGKRGTVRFFAKRISCNCLEDLYEEVRKQPKMGRCYNCCKDFEFLNLKECMACSVVHYCSKECQLENWSEHKVYCDRYAGCRKYNARQLQCTL